MRISQFYELGRTQPSLEFVDVDIYGDIPAFIDPRSLRYIESNWAKRCVSLMQSFFDAVIYAIRSGDNDRAKILLASLSEPNETHLGLSRRHARGSGVGRRLAEDLWESLATSQAVDSGLLEDLEDTALFVPGIRLDRVSDITTNIIREPLIQFTQDACGYYGIPLEVDVDSGQLWDPQARRWTQEFTRLPIADGQRLLLVPKTLVRRHPSFDPKKYYDNFVMPLLQSEELRAGSSLVQFLRSGEAVVYKKAVKAKYGAGKDVNLSATLRHPEILDQYRASMSGRSQPPNHPEVADTTGTPLPDWDMLLSKLDAIPPGHKHATDYHYAVEELLSALFHPALGLPYREFPVHGGRKRIDISYVNFATSGFFDWVNRVFQAPAPNVYVECKNHGSDLGNPEVDQIAGRFSPFRGRVGLLCHRGFGDKAALIARCRDTALDDRGFIIPLDDEDLRALVAHRVNHDFSFSFPLLRDRLDQLV